MPFLMPHQCTGKHRNYSTVRQLICLFWFKYTSPVHRMLGADVSLCYSVQLSRVIRVGCYQARSAVCRRHHQTAGTDQPHQYRLLVNATLVTDCRCPCIITINIHSNRYHSLLMALCTATVGHFIFG